MTVPTFPTLSPETTKLLQMQSGRLRHFKNLRRETFKQGDSDLAVQLFELCRTLHLFKDPTLGFTDEELLEVMISKKLRTRLQSTSDDYEGFKRLVLAVFVPNPSGLPREDPDKAVRSTLVATQALFDMCVALGLFADKKPLVWFTSDELARILHAQQDNELRAQGLLVFDERADAVIRFRALRAICGIINTDPSPDSIELSHFLHRERLLDSASKGDTERARQWFVDGNSLAVFDLLVALIGREEELTEAEYVDFLDRAMVFIQNVKYPLAFLEHPRADQARKIVSASRRPRHKAWYLAIAQRYHSHQAALWLLDDPDEPISQDELEELCASEMVNGEAGGLKKVLETYDLFDGTGVGFSDLVAATLVPFDPQEILGDFIAPHAHGRR